LSQQTNKQKSKMLNPSGIKTRKAKKLNLDGVDLYGIYSEGCMEFVTSDDERDVLTSLGFKANDQSY